jgi:hypothetical protein
VSSSFAAEPIPHQIDPVLAEYLDRQFQAIMVALRSDFQVPKFTRLPDAIVPGAVIHIASQKDDEDEQKKNGFYVCVANDKGAVEWKRMVLEDPPQGTP